MIDWAQNNRIGIIVILALAVILMAPFALRPREGRISRDTERLVIISPHNETIRSEFGAAFTRHMKETQGRDVVIDWRTPGGTSEITKILNSEFIAAFEHYWDDQEYDGWTEVATVFNDRKLPPPEPGASANPGQTARQLFLNSSVGIGIDLFWGGGSYDFQKQAGKGHLVAADPSGRYGIAALAKEKPEWFTEEIIPASFSGETFYDQGHRWVGTCLSSFGICYNSDSLERLGITEAPSTWADLADPRYFGQIALADPNKSGSVTKAFEMVLQQALREAVEDSISRPAPEGMSPEQVERRALAEGWRQGMARIQKITANARYFTDSSTKIPLDVAQGDAAAGMCVDFYGRTYNEIHRKSDGSSRINYVMPEGGSSLTVDPVGLLRGAPHPELAHAYLRFLLSKEGQRLWNYRPGTPGGPEKTAIRRLPVRRDMYGPEETKHFSDPEELPYQSGKSFTYEAEWTSSAFDSIRFIIRLMAIDSHEEQQEAWKAIIDSGMSPRGLEIFSDLSIVSYEKATSDFARILRSGNKREQVETARSLGDLFRSLYADSIRASRMEGR